MSVGRYLAGNPVVVDIDVAAIGVTSFEVRIGDSYERLIYTGTVSTLDGASTTEVNITELFSDYANLAGVVKASIKSNGITQYITIYGGAISKLLVRLLANAGANIFDWKLKNEKTNFFLTTRSNGSLITIPENELMPLWYYRQGMTFDVKCDDITVFSATDDSELPDDAMSIDLAALRQTMATNNNRMPAVFSIVSSTDISCTIVITEVRESTPFYLKFRNSWGAWEKIALTNYVQYIPEFSNNKAFEKFDEVVNDFISTSTGYEIKNMYSAQYGYRTSQERMFVTDLIHSDNVIVCAYDEEYKCNVTLDSDILGATEGEPVGVNLKIELQDKDRFFTPIV